MFMNPHATEILAAGLVGGILALTLLTGAVGADLIAEGLSRRFAWLRRSAGHVRRQYLLLRFWMRRNTLQRGYQGRHWQHRIPITEPA